MILDDIKSLIKDFEEVLIKDKRFRNDYKFKSQVRTIYGLRKVENVFVPFPVGSGEIGTNILGQGAPGCPKCPPCGKCPECQKCPECKICEKCRRYEQTDLPNVNTINEEANKAIKLVKSIDGKNKYLHILKDIADKDFAIKLLDMY